MATFAGNFHWQLFFNFFGLSLATLQLHEAEVLKIYRKVSFIDFGVMNIVIFAGIKGINWTLKRPDFILQLSGCQMIPEYHVSVFNEKICYDKAEVNQAELNKHQWLKIRFPDSKFIFLKYCSKKLLRLKRSSWANCWKNEDFHNLKAKDTIVQQKNLQQLTNSLFGDSW